MNFVELENHKLIRTAISEVVKQFPDEYWRQKDAKGEFPREFWDSMAQHDWFRVNIPEKYGGSGLGMMEASIVIHEVARAGAGVPGADLFMRTLVFAGQTISSYGTDEMKNMYLSRIADGKLICSFAHTEPNAGVNTFDVETFAEMRDGRYHLRGQKIWITLAHMADIMIVVARTRPKEQVEMKSDGITLFLVEKDSTIRTSRIPGMALNTLGSSTVFFDDTEVHPRNVIGEVDKGWVCLSSLLNAERISTAAMSVGVGELVLDRAVKYAKERVVFGRPIGMNQAIQFPLAQCKMQLEAAKLMTQKAAWLFDAKRDCAFEANVAAYLGAKAAFEAADRAVQTLGGMGFAKEYDIERHWRDLRLFRTAPVPEEMVLNYVGQHVLGLPRSF